jgi:hypothetical protein
MNVFSKEQVDHAFATGAISLLDFIEVYIDNFGSKKTSKIVRKNIEAKMISEGISKQEIAEHLQVISILIQSIKKRAISKLSSEDKISY